MTHTSHKVGIGAPTSEITKFLPQGVCNFTESDDTQDIGGFAPTETQPGQWSEGHVISLQTHRHQRPPGAGAL
jgi:hypothetical protein